MKRILITGGAGFIGSHLANSLYDLGFHVSLLDLPGSFSKEQTSKYKTYEHSIVEPDELDKLPDFDVLYHLASEVGTWNSLQNPVKDLRCNVEGTLNMIHFASSRSIKKFIFSSSMAIYGEARNASESRSPRPSSPYGISKSCAENYINFFQRSNPNVPCTIFRIFNCYGPNQETKGQSKGLLSIFLEQVKAGNKINVTGELTRKRDVIYISDVISALLLPLEKSAMRGSFNVCSGNSISIKNLIDKIISTTGQSRDKFIVSNVGANSGDPHSVTGTNSKLKKIGWEPAVSLEQGIRKCWVTHE